MLDNLNSKALFLKSTLSKGFSATFTVTGDAEFCYIGRTSRILTPLYFAIEVLVSGVGAQTAECGFFSSPLPPQNQLTGQTLSKIVATGSMDALTGTGIKRNTSAFTTAIPAFTHVWAGIRTAMATSQPAFTSIGSDFQEDYILVCNGSGPLTGAGPFVCTTLGDVPSQIGDMRMELF